MHSLHRASCPRIERTQCCVSGVGRGNGSRGRIMKRRFGPAACAERQHVWDMSRGPLHICCRSNVAHVKIVDEAFSSGPLKNVATAKAPKYFSGQIFLKPARRGRDVFILVESADTRGPCGPSVWSLRRNSFPGVPARATRQTQVPSAQQRAQSLAKPLLPCYYGTLILRLSYLCLRPPRFSSKL